MPSRALPIAPPPATPAAPLAPGRLRGAARLAVDATLGLADLVEAMHLRVASLPGRRAAPDAQAQGLTGLVYRSIRGVTRGVGQGVDALLARIEPLVATAQGDGPSSPAMEATLAALNGVLGDHLARTRNPLATPLSFRHEGRLLPLDRRALAEALPHAGGRPLVLIHGLCMNDLQWRRGGHDHGTALAESLGFTPVYLRYNSGLHVSHNGRALADALEQLLEAWPRPVERFAIVGHSMGGLLARSALHHGAAAGHRWPGRLDDLVCLGTPHHGAPLERVGHLVDSVLGVAPYAAPLARLGRLRSAGITDLRHGAVLDEGDVGADADADADSDADDGGATSEPAVAVPLPAGPRCHAIAATTGARTGSAKDRLLGDGLVPVASALGQHRLPHRRLRFPREHQRVFTRMNHMELLSRPEVFEQLREWLGR